MTIAVGPSVLFKKAVNTPIDRRTLPDELVGHLREMIGSGQLRAGSRVSVTGLCRRFGVSRTPLREALKMLAVEGLTIPEIAEIMQMPEGTVKSRIFYARKRLKNALDRKKK